MARPNIKEETKRFKEKLENGEFKVDRSGNSEVNYNYKIDRDTNAIKNTGNLKLFQKFFDLE
jgi:hypothetical protein